MLRRYIVYGLGIIGLFIVLNSKEILSDYPVGKFLLIIPLTAITCIISSGNQSKNKIKSRASRGLINGLMIWICASSLFLALAKGDSELVGFTWMFTIAIAVMIDVIIWERITDDENWCFFHTRKLLKNKGNVPNKIKNVFRHCEEFATWQSQTINGLLRRHSQ